MSEIKCKLRKTEYCTSFPQKCETCRYLQRKKDYYKKRDDIDE